MVMIIDEILGILFLACIFFGIGFFLLHAFSSKDVSDPIIQLLFKVFGFGLIVVSCGFTLLLVRVFIFLLISIHSLII